MLTVPADQHRIINVMLDYSYVIWLCSDYCSYSRYPVDVKPIIIKHFIFPQISGAHQCFGSVVDLRATPDPDRGISTTLEKIFFYISSFPFVKFQLFTGNCGF